MRKHSHATDIIVMAPLAAVAAAPTGRLTSHRVRYGAHEKDTYRIFNSIRARNCDAIRMNFLRHAAFANADQSGSILA
jgi:hypothetical protein